MIEATALAPRWRRLLATLIDALLVPSLSLVLIAVTGAVEDAEDFSDSFWVAHVLMLAITAYLLLNGGLLWRRGQTVGKAMLGIAVAHYPRKEQETTACLNKAPLWKLVLVRAWFFPLLFAAVVPVVGLVALADHLFIFTRQRRCLHDLLCGTVVVRADRMKIGE